MLFSLRTNITSILLTFAVYSLAAIPQQNGPTFHFAQSPGPYPVGLKVVEQYDRSRVFTPLSDDLGEPSTGERARPLQTLIWYPAAVAAGRVATKPMTVRDYVDLMMNETDFVKGDSKAGDRWRKGTKPTLHDSLWAVRDAPAASGRFPVFIYAPSFGAMSWENADLCELLATHGYLVIASTALGADSRSMTDDVAGLNSQARDISFLIGFAAGQPNADMSQVAVGGFSWGGMANLFAAARDSRIRALVCLDGSMRYYPGLVKQAGDVHPDQMTIPLIFFTQGEMTLETLARYLTDPAKTQGENVLNAWVHGDLITVHMSAMMHGEFSSMDQRNEDIWNETQKYLKGDYGREDGITGYSFMCRYTLAFLDAYLKHDASEMAWLAKAPAENGVPKHFLSVDVRRGKGLAPSLEAFRTELRRRGFDHVDEAYAAIKKENPAFKIERQVLDDWGDRLVNQSHLQEAIAILSFDVAMYPDSIDGLEHLGEAQEKSGQKQLAMENYQKVLAKDPDNVAAKQHLSEIQK